MTLKVESTAENCVCSRYAQFIILNDIVKTFQGFSMISLKYSTLHIHLVQWPSYALIVHFIPKSLSFCRHHI